MSKDEAVSAKIDEIHAIARRIDQSIDFLALELRPALLDHFGLYAALDKYVYEWSQHACIPAELLASKFKHQRLELLSAASLKLNI